MRCVVPCALRLAYFLKRSSRAAAEMLQRVRQSWLTYVPQCVCGPMGGWSVCSGDLRCASRFQIGRVAEDDWRPDRPASASERPCLCRRSVPAAPSSSRYNSGSARPRGCTCAGALDREGEKSRMNRLPPNRHPTA